MSFKKDFNKEFHKIQKSMLAHAEELGAINGVELNYSDDSIKLLDKMFVGIAKELEEAGVHKNDIESNKSAQGIAEAIGFYIVECIERQEGRGRWLQDGDGYGFETKSGAVIYPMVWSMKKMLDPSGYSLATTYHQWVT